MWIPQGEWVEIVVQHDVEATMLHVPIFRWAGHVELSWKKSQRDEGAWKTQYKGKFMRIKKNSKNYVFLNRNSEHIAGYLIHLNKNKTKWKSKTTQNWMEFQQSMSYNL
jgi:hypothetical protein